MRIARFAAAPLIVALVLVTNTSGARRAVRAGTVRPASSPCISGFTASPSGGGVITCSVTVACSTQQTTIVENYGLGTRGSAERTFDYNCKGLAPNKPLQCSSGFHEQRGMCQSEPVTCRTSTQYTLGGFTLMTNEQLTITRANHELITYTCSPASPMSAPWTAKPGTPVPYPT